MATTYVDSVELTTITCHKCAGLYALQENWRRKRQDDGGSWNCPYCDVSTCYVTTEVQRLKDSLEQEQRRLVNERARHDQTRADLRETEARRRAEKAAKTRLKKRAAKGLCPCCNKQFADLHNHMQRQHPNFAAKPAPATP
jgi:hypothetical protein